MLNQKTRDVARANLPHALFPAADVEEEEPVVTASTDTFTNLEDAFADAEDSAFDDGIFFPQAEKLARHIGHAMRNAEGVQMHGMRDVFAHEWGWSIDLHFHSIRYSLLLCENPPMTNRWQIVIRCSAGLFDRLFNRKLIRYCDEHLLRQVKTVLLEYPGIEALEWE